MRGKDDRSLSRSDKTHKGSLSSVDTFKARSNPNLARKSPFLSRYLRRTMAEDLSKIKIFSKNEINVFWNVEHYPIPADLHSIYPNLSSALQQMGFYGSMDINLYGDNINHSIDELFDVRINYLPKEKAVAGEDSTESRLCLDMITYASASQYHGEQINLVLIAKQNKESELHKVLQCLKSRNHTVLLVEPPDDTAQSSLFHSVDSVVDRTQVLGGGKPISGSPPISPSSSGSMNSDNDADNEEDANSSVN